MKTLIVILGLVTTINSRATESLQSEIASIVERHKTLGGFQGNIEVRLDGESIYQESYGYANLAFQVPHDSRSRFMIASVSKSFTAALILKLHDLDVIDIDAPYSDYVDVPARTNEENSTQWNNLKITDLLTHQANLIRDVKQSEFYTNEMYQPMISIIVGEMMENHDVFFENPERLSHYSNLGYVLLAYLAQEVTGKNYHEALREYVLEPLNLQSTGQYHRMFAIDWMADGYVIPESGRDSMRKRCCFDTTSFVGSHSLYSDSSDLFVWLETLMGENDFFATESLKRLQQPIAPVAYSEDLAYGFGVFVDEVLGHKRVWHDGFESGYLSLISTIEDIDLKIVILGNRHNQNVYFGQFYTQEMNDEISETVVRWQNLENWQD